MENARLEDFMEVILWENLNVPYKIFCHRKHMLGRIISHWHKEFEITCMFDGKADFYIDGSNKVLDGTGICIINSEAVHYASPRMENYIEKMSDDFGAITILINFDYLTGLIPNFHEYYFVIDSEKTEKKLCKMMVAVYQLYTKASGIPSQLRILAFINEILALLYEKCRKDRLIIPINTQRDRERIKIIIEYLNQHYAEELNQEELSQKFHFSRGYFSRFFKVQTGMTYKEYIIKYRLEKAMEELLNTNHSILDISENNGFGSETQFITWFQRQYHNTPAKYRKAIFDLQTTE